MAVEAVPPTLAVKVGFKKLGVGSTAYYPYPSCAMSVQLSPKLVSLGSITIIALSFMLLCILHVNHKMICMLSFEPLDPCLSTSVSIILIDIRLTSLHCAVIIAPSHSSQQSFTAIQSISSDSPLWDSCLSNWYAYNGGLLGFCPTGAP